MSMTDCDIGLMGLAVMGQNLVLNMAEQGYKVCVYNRTTSKVDAFVNGDEAKQFDIVGAHSLSDLVANLKRPRKVMLMIKSGDAVPTLDDELYPQAATADAVIEQLAALLDPGDIIIDGGNTHFRDTERRTKWVEAQGLLYVGTGVSGGEEGARFGPSMMPGGSPEAWPAVQPIFQAIAAKVGAAEDIPCCEWVGPRGAGHYVKMVHNGIEYGDMQLICEAYVMLKQGAGLSNDELYDVFDSWNHGELQSYLIEISRDIFSVKDPQGEGYLLDKILDSAGAKGTGKWMSQLALDLGVPSTLVTAAVYARGLSGQKQQRLRASQVFSGPDTTLDLNQFGGKAGFIEAVRQALYASKICSYAQGFVQLQAAAKEHQWPLNYGDCALLWRGGCIIRAQFLDRIKEAFDEDPQLENLLLHPYFKDAVTGHQASWRKIVIGATELGVAVPAFSSALNYFDSYRTPYLPANLLQAQRDYFGAHTYQRTDQEGTYHSDWLHLRKSPKT